MANVTSSAFLNNPHQVGFNYTDEASRRFVAYTDILAGKLLKSGKDTVEQNSDTAYSQSYIQFANENPSHLRNKNGGIRADTLANVIRSYYSATAPANVPHGDIVSLSSSGAISGDMNNSSLTFSSVPIVELTYPANTTATIVGTERADVTLLNTGAAAVDVVFNFGRLARTVNIEGSAPFQMSLTNQPPPAARRRYRFRPAEGPFSVVLPVGNPIVLSVTAATEINVPLHFDLDLVEAGFNRAMIDGLFDSLNVTYYSSFDSFIIAQYHALDGINRLETCVTLGLALQAYQQLKRVTPRR